MRKALSLRVFLIVDVTLVLFAPFGTDFINSMRLWTSCHSQPVWVKWFMRMISGFCFVCTSSQWFGRKVAAPQYVWSLCLWRINLAQLHTNEVQPVGYMTLLSSPGEVGTADPHSVLFVIRRDHIVCEATKKLRGYHEREYTVWKEAINIQDAAEIHLMQMKTAISLLFFTLNQYNRLDATLWRWGVLWATCHFLWLE